MEKFNSHLSMLQYQFARGKILNRKLLCLLKHCYGDYTRNKEKKVKKLEQQIQENNTNFTCTLEAIKEAYGSVHI